MTQPPQPMAPGQQFAGPTGQLVLNLRKPWGSAGMINPNATIDGYPAAVQWGRNEFTAPAGARQVQISVSYLWEYGRATDTVPVQPNSLVEVYYTPPAFTFLSGSIGPVEQKRRGTTALIVILIVIALLVVLAIVGAVLD